MERLAKRQLILALSTGAIALTVFSLYRVNKPLFLELKDADKPAKKQIYREMLKSSTIPLVLGAAALSILDYSYKSLN